MESFGGCVGIMIQSNRSNQLVDNMREIQASEAKVHLPQLLDEVERGETLIVTRHGRPIARIVPEVDRRQEEVNKALAGIRELRRRNGRITVGELLSARDEGRKP
jgi:prevent-host-death family protein